MRFCSHLKPENKGFKCRVRKLFPHIIKISPTQKKNLETLFSVKIALQIISRQYEDINKQVLIVSLQNKKVLIHSQIQNDLSCCDLRA